MPDLRVLQLRKNQLRRFPVGRHSHDAFGYLATGEPIGALSEAGAWRPMSDNVTVYGSFHFSESCTFDPNKNLILAMNAGNRGDTGADDGYVSLINPDGSVHTPKWIGATRDGLELHDPLGSAISSGVLYTVDSGHVRQFDLQSGRPLRSVPVPGSTLLNGIAVADDGTVYASNTRPVGQIWKVTADGEASLFADGAPLQAPNGVAIDQDGNVVVVNVGDNAVITYNRSGEVIQTEHSVEGGNDGVVVTADGTKYVSSVRYGSVSRYPSWPRRRDRRVGYPKRGVHVLRLDSEPTGHSTEQQLRARVCQAQQSGLDCRLGLNHQPIQRHLPVQRGIGGLIGLPHAALANEGGDVVAPLCARIACDQARN